MNLAEMDLAELLVQEGVAAAPEQIREVLERAAGEGRHPIAALVEEGIVVEDLLADLLARAAGTVVVDLDRGAPEGDVPHLVSGAMAREHLFIPLSAAGGKLRVAFVNPLDHRALRAVREASGYPIQPLVGTLSGLRQAVARAYATRTTRVMRAASEMPEEDTRKVELAPGDTAPIHRLEQEATTEQRHEALLLALIERGVLTRADYVEALKRLLARR